MHSSTLFIRRMVLFLMAACLVVSGMALIFSSDAYNSVMFIGAGDSQMDLFHSLLACMSYDPYGPETGHSIYPPLTNVIFRVMEAFIAPQAEGLNAYELRNTQLGRILFLFFVLSAMVPLAFMLFKQLRGKELERYVLMVCMMLCAPMFYLLDRGNILLWALVLTGAFLFSLDSENKVVREIGLISLACAASIKIYPAIFGLLLVRRKQWKETIRCLIYGVAVFILPFFFFAGLHSAWGLIGNMREFSGFIGEEWFYRVDLGGVTVRLLQWFGVGVTDAITTSNWLRLPFLAVLVAAALVQKEEWKACLSLSLIAVMLPTFSYFYTAVFYILPLTMLLHSEEHRPLDVVYALLTCGLVVLLALPSSMRPLVACNYGMMHVCTSLELCNWCEIGLTLLLCGDTAVQLIRRKKNGKRLEPLRTV